MPGKKNLVVAISNANHQKDINYNIELNRWLLKAIGTWPRNKNTSLLDILFSRFLNVLHTSLISFLLIGTVLYILLDVQDIQAKLNKIGPVTFTIATLIKYWLLIFHESEIKHCLDHIEIDWKGVRRQEDRRIMLESAHIGRRIVGISASLIFGALFLYRVIVPLNSPKMVIGNLTFRPLAYPVSKVIIDTRQTPANELILLIQCICGFIMSAITVGSCSLVAICSLHACGQLKILMHWLNHLVNGHSNENDTIDDRLRDIVKKHVRVLKYIVSFIPGLKIYTDAMSDRHTSDLAFFQFHHMYGKFYGWNHISTINMFAYIILLTSFVFNIFIICYIGELLAHECKKMAESTYMINWYQLKGKKALSLILIISMSLSSSRLTAGKFIELSLKSFSDVIKTSVGYLNMLRAITS
ncbi:odorant receptor 4-like [Vespa crabro]|uniref:odorant receptor 4-like n=1 Tax=Vespa crabro TaxID=7445 RepID=UPI001F027564|nr:odorant receptor 4-like [Vespa crabro]